MKWKDSGSMLSGPGALLLFDSSMALRTSLSIYMGCPEDFHLGFVVFALYGHQKG